MILLNGSNYEDPGLDISTVNSGTVYASFLLNVVNPGNTTGDYIAHFSPTGGSGTHHGRLYVRQGSSASYFQLGIGHGTTPTTWTADYPVGTPVLVVIGYTFVAGSNNDISSLWINPQLKQSTPPPPDYTSTYNSTDYTSLGRICLRQGSGSTSLQVQLDELRVSTSWGDVTLPVTLSKLAIE